MEAQREPDQSVRIILRKENYLKSIAINRGDISWRFFWSSLALFARARSGTNKSFYFQPKNGLSAFLFWTSRAINLGDPAPQRNYMYIDIWVCYFLHLKNIYDLAIFGAKIVVQICNEFTMKQSQWVTLKIMTQPKNKTKKNSRKAKCIYN